MTNPTADLIRSCWPVSGDDAQHWDGCWTTHIECCVAMLCDQLDEVLFDWNATREAKESWKQRAYELERQLAKLREQVPLSAAEIDQILLDQGE